MALHGWGANAQDLAALAPYLNLPDYQFVFPNAPFPHTYAPGGRMWYDIPANFSFQRSADVDQWPELAASRQQLRDWLLGLEAETGVPLSQTILSGFSQGGAMTLDVGLTLPLAALMVLSGYLHAPAQIEPSPPPVLMVHGQQDMVVPLRAAQQARDSLQQQGVAVTYHELADMGHEIDPMVLKLMQSFVGEPGGIR